MIWECDGCGLEVKSDPLSHTDYGGEIKLQGPNCPQCGQSMDFVRDETT